MSDAGTTPVPEPNDVVRDRLPQTQDAGMLVSKPDHPFHNARTWLSPLVESEGVVLRSEHPHASTVWFAVEDDTLAFIRESPLDHLVDEVKTGINAVAAFAHAYGHDQSSVTAVPIEHAPDALREWTAKYRKEETDR